MKVYEFEGKTTQEAIEKASRELNLPPEELDIDIIEPGSAGIFGLVGTKKTRIKVNSKDTESSDDLIEIEKAKEILEGILALLPVQTTVKGEKTDGKISLNIEGDTSGLLIGRRGETLDALQHVVNKSLNKTTEKKVRVIVDSENYRQRRADSLKQLALKTGDKAKRLEKPCATGLLNPHDRRIVHLTLKEDADVETRSRGEGIFKKVMVIPKK
jgi:spoIIIJ-associated protein